MAEERRLLYVGMTRAKDNLYLLRARRRRSPYGSYETMQASRFLEAIPNHLIQGNFNPTVSRRETYDYRAFQWDRTYGSANKRSRTSSPPKMPQQRFFPEMHVTHPVYGEGVVRNSRLEYGDETVEVYFEGLGLKALVASMSSLEILDN